MNTFIPYKNFNESARVLDDKRLGKQRVEVLQILNAIHYHTGWRHHPIVKMWAPYVNALVEYGVAICDEWISRGFDDTCKEKILSFKNGEVIYPKWWGGEIHRTHQSNLLRKNKNYYNKYFNDIPDDLPYIWYDEE